MVITRKAHKSARIPGRPRNLAVALWPWGAGWLPALGILFTHLLLKGLGVGLETPSSSTFTSPVIPGSSARPQHPFLGDALFHTFCLSPTDNNSEFLCFRIDTAFSQVLLQLIFTELQGKLFDSYFLQFTDMEPERAVGPRAYCS